MREVVLRVVLAALLLVPVPAIVTVSGASAHPGNTAADGCHYCRTNCARWGETAGARHCHGGGGGDDGGDVSSGGGAPPPPPPPPPKPRDTTPPARPLVGPAATKQAEVTLPVTAEAGARVAVASAGAVLHQARATGTEQTLVFTVPDGRHVLVVTATDAAGNESEAASVTVTADATPPAAPTVIVLPARPQSPQTRLRISGDGGSTYRLVVRPAGEGAAVADETGRLPGSGQLTHPVLLPNGSYVAASTLTDLAGNRSTERTESFQVAIPAPGAPALSVSSDAGASPLVILVEGTPFGTVTVRLRGAHTRVPARTAELDRSGSARLSFDLDDDVYEAVAEAEDFQGQAAVRPARLDGIPVKQTPPRLDVALREEELAKGRLGYVVSGDPGTTVTLRVEGAEPVTLRLDDSEIADILQVGAGEHVLAVSAVDEFGNETVQELFATVADPAGPLDAVLVLGFLVGLPYLLYRKRHRLLAGLRRLRPAAATAGGAASDAPTVAAEEPGQYEA